MEFENGQLVSMETNLESESPPSSHRPVRLMAAFFLFTY